jgi:D-alanyl-D-alanine carboxypeptidase
MTLQKCKVPFAIIGLARYGSFATNSPMKWFPTAICMAFLCLFPTRILADAIDDFVYAEIKKRQIQGLALGVIHRGREIKTAEYGLANVELNTKVNKDTVFEIGAVTTQFTTAGILILMQDGKLSLDDEISRHLSNTPPAWRGITIRDLLTQSSGLKNFTALTNGFELTKHLTQAEFIGKIADFPLSPKAGETNIYCSTGFRLLEFIIENASGKNYWDFLDTRIFQPLGMRNSGDREPTRIIANRADGYEILKNGTLSNRDSDLTDMGGAGAMTTCIRDMLKWDDALNTEKILSTASKQLMWTQVDLPNGKKGTFGLGCRVERNGVFRLVYYSGSTSGFSCAYMRVPELGLGIVVLTNTGEAGTAISISRMIANSYLEGK